MTENPAALRRWMVSGPEVAGMIKEFENVVPSCKFLRHHEQTPSTQTAFKKDVLSVVSEFNELGNPFEEQGDELIAVHTRDVMDSAVVDTVQNVLQIGKSQYDSYVEERLIARSKRITDTIKKNNLPLLSTLGKKCQSKEKAQVASLKEDCTLFSRLYIACQSRDGNLDEFFITESRPLKHVDRTCKLSSKKVNRACVTRCRDAERCQSLKSLVYINVETIVPKIFLRSLDLFIV